MRSHLTILLTAVLLLPACDRLDSAFGPDKSQQPATSDRPERIEFVVDGDGVYYATRRAGGKIHNAQRIDDIPLAERGTTLVYVEGKTPELRGEEERYVADLSDAEAGETTTARLRPPQFVRASEAAGMAGARAALDLRRLAQPEQAEQADGEGKAVLTEDVLRPETPESAKLADGSAESGSAEAGSAEAGSKRNGNITIESVGGTAETNSLGFGNSKKVGSPAVTVYYADWCGVCKRAMGWMDRNDVTYRAVDIEASDENRREMVDFCREKGRRAGSVPTIRIGDEIMTGWNARRFQQIAGI